MSACALALLGIVMYGAQQLWHYEHDAVVCAMLAAAPVYAVAAGLVWRFESAYTPAVRRRALIIIVSAAVIGRVCLLWPPPVSTDIFRYVWDGRMQAAGINPYRYRPADPAVAKLRDPAVYPQINRAATAVTIYPPLAQMIFLGTTRLWNSVTGMKAAMLGFELAGIGALVALLLRAGLPGTRVLFYAWNPLPLFEFAGSGHIDAAAIALMLFACLAAQRRRPLTAGVLLGGAAAVKFFPAVIAPALYRRWGWRLPVGFLAAVVLLYLPYLGVGWRVFGFLPGYVQVEGLADGSGYFLLNALHAALPLPSWSPRAYLALGLLLLGALAWAVIQRRRPDQVSMHGALLLMAIFTLWVSPHLAWYFTWLIPFLCFKPSWALMYLTAAAPLLYDNLWSPGPLPLHAALYLPCALIFALELWLASRKPPLELTHDGPLRTPHAS